MRYFVKKLNTILGVRFAVYDGERKNNDYAKCYMFEDEANRVCNRLNLEAQND